MVTFAVFSHRRRKSRAVVLALCWISGLLLGIATYSYAGESLFSMMRSAAGGAVSIVSLLRVTLFPFLITALAVLLSQSALLLVCFGKAFLFSFTAMGFMRAFGTAGWLCCRWALFSAFAILPLLYYLWLRLLHRRSGLLELLAVLALAVLIVSFDHRIVSPLWASMIEI